LTPVSAARAYRPSRSFHFSFITAALAIESLCGKSRPWLLRSFLSPVTLTAVSPSCQLVVSRFSPLPCALFLSSCCDEENSAGSLQSSDSCFSILKVELLPTVNSLEIGFSTASCPVLSAACFCDHPSPTRNTVRQKQPHDTKTKRTTTLNSFGLTLWQNVPGCPYSRQLASLKRYFSSFLCSKHTKADPSMRAGVIMLLWLPRLGF
jgi:hypothetical protein